MLKSAFITLVLVTLGFSLVHSVEPSCPRPSARCPRSWNYSNADKWGELCPGWKTCSTGSEQSPIDIFAPPVVVGKQKSFNIRYPPLSNVWIFNTGNKFIFPVNQKATFDYNGIQYFLQTVEFHAPSEHLFEGRRYNLEMQLLHKAGNSRTLIVSIFFDVGCDNRSHSNQFMDQIQYNLPQFPGAMCGNGRIENLAGYFREDCDNGPRNSNNSTEPNCCRTNCRLAECGDGIKDIREQCDTGAKNADAPGMCRKNCTLPACGDRIVDPGEQCDDGNVQNGDGCTSLCVLECGDGALNRVEQCDDGPKNNDTQPNACRTNCLKAHCGDNVIDQKEDCDDGQDLNMKIPNFCRPDCKKPKCGDSITDDGEECDDGADNGDGKSCSATCKSNCGNGKIDDGEQCDSGNRNSDAPNALCRTNCRARYCGDGIIDDFSDEQCDSGVPGGTIWCNANCTQVCGNAAPEGTEECDNGCSNSDTPDAPCRTNCKKPACGDGIVDRQEDCDLGSVKNSDAPNGLCRTNCKAQRCGDGIVDSGEECDNGKGNLLGSGCHFCRSECGNGFLEGDEVCDFGNLNSNTAPDTCRKNCQLPHCGDGVVDSREECDAGQSISATAPNGCRPGCLSAWCGDGVIDPSNGEQCDDGDQNSDTAVSGCSSDCILNKFRQSFVLGNGVVDLNRALPKDQKAVSYVGSLSSPPCTEGIQWLLFQEVQHITKQQFNSFTASPFGIYNNIRPPQRLCGRTVSRPFDRPQSTCGDGVQDNDEDCDLGHLRNSDVQANRCRKNCKLPECGDGVTDQGEECDDGAGSARCTNGCHVKVTLVNPFVCPAWGYKDSCKWGSLCKEWELCNSERPNAQQSPINIDLSPKLGRGKFDLTHTYTDTNILLVNTGRGVSFVNGNPRNIFYSPKKAYTLQSIRFHTPSEHTINGKLADVEAQFHHVSQDDGTVAVISVLFNLGARSSFLDQFLFYLPGDTDCRCGNGIVEAGEECDNGQANSNTRPEKCRLDCKLPRCGDNVVDRGEQCDHGVSNSNRPRTTCTSDCQLPYCGDGILNFGENCDNGGDPQRLPLCDSSCRLLCGNGILEAGEQCDNGTNDDWTPNACRTDCQKAGCGDGVIDKNEECDDGFLNANKPDFCRPTTCAAPFCGDGITDSARGEECDHGANDNKDGNTCNSSCKLSCGNGVKDVGEDCDNGPANANIDGACRTNCRNPICGDFIIDSASEKCDDGPEGSIWCSNNCTILCGNGQPDPNEKCDDGAANSDTVPNACRTNCRLSFCGDGVRDAVEMCDFGSRNSDDEGANSPCRMNCELPKCGDGVLDSVEDCDDGNNENGDGCSATCNFECGNGRRDGGEECDDGPLNSLLPNSCRPQSHSYGGCMKPRCGDGILDDGEQCDDGEGNNSNLPNSCRVGCTLPKLGDGIVDDLYGEKCDTGSLMNDGFGSCSTMGVLNSCRQKAPTSVMVKLQNVFDRTSPVLTYQGSSTTPPCQEGWTYFILEKIATLDRPQLEALQKALPFGNARGVQPLNGRTVAYTSTHQTVCGDGIVERDEECDNGDLNANQPNKCRPNCKKPTCGDGILDAGEKCDQGRARNSPNGPCGLDCTWAGTPASAGCNNKSSSCSTSPTTTINVIFANLLKGAHCSAGTCGNCQD